MKHPEDYRKPFYKRQELRFECTRCGACCTGSAEEYVFLGRDEARRLGDHLGLSWPWFRRHYLARTAENDLVLRMRDDGACILLRADGSCRAYQERPLQCRTYPFWPELMKSAKAWRREALRCEGIDRGAVVPLATIEAALREEQS